MSIINPALPSPHEAQIDKAASHLKEERNHHIVFALLIILAAGVVAAFTYTLAVHSFTYLSLGLCGGALVAAAVTAFFYKKMANDCHKTADTIIQKLPLPAIILEMLKGRESAKTLFYLLGGQTKSGKEGQIEIAPASAIKIDQLVKEGPQMLLDVAGRGDASGVEILLQNHVDLSGKDENGRNAFQIAAVHGHGSVLRVMQQMLPQIDVNAKDNNGQTALMLACSAGHLDAASFLLGISNLSLTDLKGRNALMLAAQNGQTAVIVEISQRFRHFNFDAKDNEGRTALMLASVNGHSHAAGIMIGNSNPNLVDPQNHTSLMLAAIEGHEEVVKVHVNAVIPFEDGIIPDFLTNVPRLNQQDSEGNTALIHALKREQWNMAAALMEKPFNPNIPNNEGVTPLMLAVIGGRTDLVTTLLEKGADPTKINDQSGGFPLLLALQHGHFEVAKLLMKDPRVAKQFDLADRVGHTPLQLASMGGNEEIVKALLESHVNPDKVDQSGHSALFFAAANGHDKVVKLLCQHQANRLLRDNFQETPLIVAAKNGHTSVIALLTTASRSQAEEQRKRNEAPSSLESEGVDLINQNGESALMLAAKAGNLEAVKLLGLASAHLNQKSHKWGGLTALMFAVTQGKGKVVAELIKQKADLNVQNNRGQTALMLAAQKNYPKIADLLLQNGARRDLRDRQGKSALDYGSMFPIMTRLIRGEGTLNQLLAKDEERNRRRDKSPETIMMEAYQKQAPTVS